MNPKLQQCYDAFDRLKEGRGTHKKCKDLPLTEITFSKISLEAGHDAGYLKKKGREPHKPLLSMLNLFLDELPKESTMGKGALLQREKDKAKIAKEDATTMEVKLEASLGRELQLYHRLKEVEQELTEVKSQLAQHSNVTRLPI